MHYYVVGQPQLVGTTSVEHSERLSQRFGAELLRRLAQVLILRDAWVEHNNKSPEIEIPELAGLSKPIQDLNTNELRQLSASGGDGFLQHR